MAVFKCKMCGGALEIEEGQSIVTCEYCGTQQTIPKVDDEKKIALFNRANNLRIKSEFDKAAGIYESIIAEFPEEAEAFWGLVLCKYGIEYVDDKDGRKIPTCHRTLPTPIMKDEDFQQACENADISAKAIYREEAKAIDGIQKKILEIAATEAPYDIFICYKETDDITGVRTEDSSIAQDIYTALTEMGYKVFYARNSLKRVAGTEYEPYIYAALSSAKIMLAIGTKYDYYDAVWVKNEWSRFISMIATNPSKILIPCFKNIDAYDIPEEFSNMQALDMADMMFFNSLEASVKRVLPLASKTATIETVAVNTGASATVDSLLKRAFMFLEDGEWSRADDFCEQVLNIDPECAEAYLCKLMRELKINNEGSLRDCDAPFDDNNNYQKAIRYGNDELISKLVGYVRYIKERNETAQLKHKQQIEKSLNEIAQKREQCSKFSSIISTGARHTVGLMLDGTVITTGENYCGCCDLSNWADIDALSAGYKHTVGLKSDGTVVAVGKTSNGRCDVSHWRDIVAVSAGENYTAGLKSSGTVVAVGSNVFGQCDVSSWKNIVAIATKGWHTVGLKSDGTVVASGNNSSSQCNVSNWSNIVAVSASMMHTVGLKSDGTVVATGDNKEGQCNVDGWTDIVAISAGSGHTVGLKSDGTVVATRYTGDSYHGQCDVYSWRDIVAISANGVFTIGLKSNGTLIGTKYTGDFYKGQCDVADWKLFDNADTFEKEKEQHIAERRKLVEEKRCFAKQQAEYRSSGLCQHCGGEFKGFIGKKCVKCGKPKDY